MQPGDVPPNQQLVRGDRWPVVGERSPSSSPEGWTVALSGRVSVARIYTLEELEALPQIERRIDIHCVTRWSKLQMRFEGVRFADVAVNHNGKPLWDVDVTHVSFVARSERGHSTSLPLNELLDLDPLLVFRAEGKPLSTEHGGPVRMVVPGKYFYKSVKWLERIEFLSSDRLGYWESEAGYHNGADPWSEQRYIAATISKQEAMRLIKQRDFSGRELLSLQASGLDLSQLNASGAMLRNADFSNTNLQQADFRQANLSNAHLQAADLRQADFRGADLEGADFSGADLRGADLRDVSLFGASFARVDSDGRVSDVAVFDVATQISDDALDGLVAEQRQVLKWK